MAANARPDWQLMNTLDYIAPDRIQSVWPTIRPGLEKVCAKSSDGWIPEDVYLSLKTGAATLHIGKGPDGYQGFLIMSQNAGFSGPVLHIWACYSEAHDFNLMIEHMAFIEGCAKNLGAKTITFTSARKGWEVQGVKIGFKPQTTVFAKELT
jgi:hypothetical protein